ncbi:MAG: hypothetical protein JSV64_00060 [Candidatus Bathyarchaeota archaeon]|nr:MAG: hypothetical protein JSV64_00060 [Candidatus Bathyarchaeota archaeon]
MNVPLRALSWAVRFFWIIAIAFAVTCVYSATLVNVDFGEPRSSHSGDDITLTVPIEFENDGYFNIADLNVTTVIEDSTGNQVSKGSSHWPQISHQRNVTILHNMSFCFDDLLTQEEYLFDDSDLALRSSISFNYADLIPFGFETNTSLPWGAPLSDFTVNTPRYDSHNVTHLRMTVPISFHNRSPYIDVTGEMRVEVFSNRYERLGRTVLSLDTPSNGFYLGEFEALVDRTLLTSGGVINVYLETESFTYGPKVIRFG